MMNETDKKIAEMYPEEQPKGEGWKPTRNEAIVEWLKAVDIEPDGIIRVILDFSATRPPRVYIERRGSHKILPQGMGVVLEDAEVWIDGKQTR